MTTESKYKHLDYGQELKQFIFEQNDKKRQALKDLKEAKTKILEVKLLLLLADHKGLLESAGVNPGKMEASILLLGNVTENLGTEIQKLQKLVDAQNNGDGPVIGHP